MMSGKDLSELIKADLELKLFFRKWDEVCALCDEEKNRKGVFFDGVCLECIKKGIKERTEEILEKYPVFRDYFLKNMYVYTLKLAEIAEHSLRKADGHKL